MTMDVENAAVHESGHAVMAWLLGLRASEISIDELGGGLYVGTGERIDAIADLLVYLAGSVAEANGLPLDVSLMKSVDFVSARGIIGRLTPHLSIDVELTKWTEEAAERLSPHMVLVERMAEHLLARKRLSARTVASLCREHRKRLSHPSMAWCG